MDASKPHRRVAAQNSIRFAMSMVVLTAALLTTTLAVPALEHGGMSGLTSHAWAAEVRGFLRNPIDYLSQRSPGARGSGPLVQSKHRMFKLPRIGVKPHEQVLSNVRYGSPVPQFVNDLVPGPGPGVIDFSAPVPAIGVGGINGGTPGSPSPIVPVSVPGSTPGSTPGGTPAGTVVPEPSTWLMLIWGMALVGFGLRSQARNRANSAKRIGFRAQI